MAKAIDISLCAAHDGFARQVHNLVVQAHRSLLCPVKDSKGSYCPVHVVSQLPPPNPLRGIAESNRSTLPTNIHASRRRPARPSAMSSLPCDYPRLGGCRALSPSPSLL